MARVKAKFRAFPSLGVAMRRRDFITLLGCAAAMGPRMVSAQQQERIRRLSVLMGIAASDLDSSARVDAFEHGLEKLGWTPGRNLRIDYRWAAGDIERIRAAVPDLLSTVPDVILADGTPALRAFHQATVNVPIVFTVVSDPVGAGFVESLRRPGGNITGFTNLEPSVGGKWLELLREIAPSVMHVGIMFNPDTAPFSIQPSRLAQAAAEDFAMKAAIAPVHEPAEIETAIAELVLQPNGGLILPQDSFTSVHRKLIVDLAARYRIPAVYAFRYFTAEGGLVSYGINVIDQMRRAATYVDRILRGKRPAELPVQQPTTFELVVNLKTAKALGLQVPPTLLARADEVLE
jgi:putative ABC transport system substrate-binding protein